MDRRFFYRTPNKTPGECLVDVLKRGDSYVVVMTEVKDNPGMSITNAAAMLASQIFREFFGGVPFPLIRWVEYWPAEKGYPEHYDEVRFEHFDPVQQEFSIPRWSPLMGITRKEDLIR